MIHRTKSKNFLQPISLNLTLEAKNRLVHPSNTGPKCPRKNFSISRSKPESFVTKI